MAGALGNGIPAQPLIVSPQHRILVRYAIARRMFGAARLLAPAKHLTGLDEIAVEERCNGITCYHLLFERHEIVLADGAEAEPLYPGVQALRSLNAAALEEIEAIFPGVATGNHLPFQARPSGKGARLRRMVHRHVANRQTLVT